ncbi:MAG TPA: hypothetical protein VND65_17965 [Candidatus Binatia bacterium]|nr:hypothetical protein [Candidatus Binatia bacterium]
MDTLLAAVQASPGRPTRDQAGKALVAWFEAAVDAEEGTAAWGKVVRGLAVVTQEAISNEEEEASEDNML